MLYLVWNGQSWLHMHTFINVPQKNMWDSTGEQCDIFQLCPVDHNPPIGVLYLVNQKYTQIKLEQSY